MVDHFGKAKKLMQNNELSKASKGYARLMDAMATGDPRAHYAIGTWYLHGFFLKKDVRRGTALIAHAADHGVADAAFDLAVSYELGIGRKASHAKALCYFVRSFLLGYRPAAVEIERLLYWGDSTVRNRPLSREFKGHEKQTPSG